MISRRQLALAAAASSAKRAIKLRAFETNRAKPGAGWSWLVYALIAFAVGLSLSYCAIQVIETAAKVAG